MRRFEELLITVRPRPPGYYPDINSEVHSQTHAEIGDRNEGTGCGDQARRHHGGLGSTDEQIGRRKKYTTVGWGSGSSLRRKVTSERTVKKKKPISAFLFVINKDVLFRRSLLYIDI